MMQRLKDIVHGWSAPPSEPQQSTAPRTAATIRAELEAARAAAASLEEKLAFAQTALQTAQRSYEQAVAACPAGFEPPDDDALRASDSRLHALQRVLGNVRADVARLSSELAEVELAEALAAGRQQLPELIAAASAKMEQIEEALRRVNGFEAELFALLFDESAGLKQFTVPELAREAAAARRRLRDRVEQMERTRRYRFDDRFETDGNVNLGRQERDSQELQRACAIALAARQAHAAALLEETGGRRR